MRSLEYVAALLPYVLVSGVLVGALVGFFVGGSELASAGIRLTGVPLLVAAAYLLVRNSANPLDTRRIETIHVPSSFFTKLFAVVYLGTVGYLLLVFDRGYAFFVLVTLLFLLAFAEGLIAETFDPRQSLGKSCALLLLLAYSLTLTTPFYFGWTDIPAHLQLSMYIVESGSPIPEVVSTYGSYANFPLYHIFVAAYIFLSNLAPDRAFFTLAGAFFALTPLLVYLLSVRVVADRRISALASLVYASLPVSIFYAGYTITRVAAFVGFLVLLFGALRVDSTNDKRYFWIVGIAIPYVLLVHQVSYIQMLAIVVILWIVAILSNSRTGITLRFILILSVVFASYWLVVAGDLFENILTDHVLGRGSTTESVGGLTTTVPTYHASEYLNEYIITTLLVIGAAIGLRSNRRRAVGFALFVLLAVPAVTYSPLHVIDRLQVFRFDRLILLVSPFIALFVALAYLDVHDRIARRTTPILALVFVSLVFATAAFSGATGGIHYNTAGDAEEIEWTGPPEHFTEAELDALNHVSYVPEDRTVRTSGPSWKYLTTMVADGEPKGHTFAVHDVSTIHDEDDTDGEYILLHEDRLSEHGLVLGQHSGTYVYQGDIEFEQNNRIYSTDGSVIFTQGEYSLEEDADGQRPAERLADADVSPAR